MASAPPDPGTTGHHGSGHAPPEQTGEPVGRGLDLVVTTPADRPHAILLRRRLQAWLAEEGVASPLAEDVVLATSEALANAADHAYRGGETGPVTLTAALTRSAVTVTVADRGRWREPSEDPGHRGFGLGMIHTLAGQVEVAHALDGTRLTARFSRL